MYKFFNVLSIIKENNAELLHCAVLPNSTCTWSQVLAGLLDVAMFS